MNGQNIAYIRVSTMEQSTARQLEGKTFDRVFEEHASARDGQRPVLQECLAYVRQGDVLHVHSIDRLARNLVDLEGIVSELVAKGVRVKFHTEGLDFSDEGTAMNRLVLQVMGAFAQFERSMIRERQREGIAAARREGKHLGRGTKITPELKAKVAEALARGENKTHLAKAMGISRQTLYKAIQETQEAPCEG